MDVSELVNQDVTVPLQDIKVGDRARVDLGEIEKLQHSIEHRGLINPITVTRDLQLVAGFRRLTCHKNLGLKVIPVRFFDELSDIEMLEIELEENIHKELTWNEEAILRSDIHSLKQKLYGKAVKGHDSTGWSLEDTAMSLGIAVGTLSQDVKLAEAIEIAPSLSKFASKRQAVKALTKAKETAILSELANRSASKENMPYLVHNGDAVEFLKKSVEDETVDLVIFDPPWGIDVDLIASSRGLSGEKTSYADDSSETARDIMSKLIPELHRVMRPDTHMYAFFGIDHFVFLRDLLSEYFQVRSLPLIWVKEGGGFTDFEVRFMPRYETFFFCSKGVRRLNSAYSDVFEFNRPASVERIHTQQKPLELIQQLIRLSSLPNEIVLDPCMGSGATLVASTVLGRRSIGIDNNEECYNKACGWLSITDAGTGEAKDEVDHEVKL